MLRFDETVWHNHNSNYSALSAKSDVIPMSIPLWKNALYIWSFHHIAHLNNIIQNPMSLRCTPTKSAKQFGSLSGPTFFCLFRASLALLHCGWFVPFRYIVFFRIYAWGYGTVKRQNNAKQTEEIKKNIHHAKKNEETI